MEFRILGPLELGTGDQVIALGGAKQRALLAVLLLHLNQVVTSEQLIDDVWGEAAPATAPKSVQVYVAGLRKALRECGGADALSTRSGGYRLELQTDAVDAFRFERLVQAGRRAIDAGRHAAAAEILREALALWRGPPLVDFRYAQFAQGEIARLQELHLSALEERTEADLALGRHRDLVAELEDLVGMHPLRERLRGQLMVALYRCGRQPEALAVYRHGRRYLIEQLGLEPSAGLKRLETAILTQSAELEAPVPTQQPTAGAEPYPLPGPLQAARGLLVGRETEAAALLAEWRRARRGERRVVVVSGEPGIGKTRLIAELCATAHAEGALVLLGRCHEDGLVPYEPFVEALRRYIADCPPSILHGRLSGAGTVLAALLPELKDRLRPGVVIPRELSAARLVGAIVALVREAARGRPTVLVLEDLHWAEQATAVALRHLVRETEGASLLVLASYRATEMNEQDALVGALAEARRDRNLAELELGGLDKQSVAAIVTATTGRDAPEHLVDAVHARTAGNPYFVEELVRDAADRGSPERLGLPQSVKDLIGRRLRAMGLGDLRLLEVAAVIGADFDLPTLGAAAEYAEDDLVDCLDSASRARAVVATAIPRTYMFAHGLVRETVYAGMSAVRRAYLHRRVGEALEARPGRHDGARSAALAYHFSAGGDQARALPHHAAAARAAARVGALDSGLGHCDAALAGIRDAGLDADPLIARVALDRGRLLHRAGRLTESVVSLEQALDGARTRGDAQLEMQTLLELGYLLRNVDVGRALQPLEAARALAERRSDSEAQVRALSRSALVHAEQLRFDRAIQNAEDALVRAQRAGDERLVAEALDAHKLVAWQLGDSERLARLTAELEAIQRRHGDLWILSWTLVEAAQIPIAALRWGEAEARLRAALALTERMDAPVNAGFVLDSLAVMHEACGAPEAGLVASERSRALFERGGSVCFAAWAQATAGLILTRLRAARRAAQHLEHGLAMAEQARSPHARLRCMALLARARWLEGDHASAVAHAEGAAQLCDSIVAPAGRALLYVAPAMACTAEVLAAAGRPEHGESLLTGALAAARSPSTALYAIPLCLAAARCLAAQGRTEVAAATLEPALEAARAGTFAPAWEAHAILAALHQAAGRDAERERQLRAARSAVAVVSRGIADAELRAGLLEAADREISQSSSAIKPAARRAPSVSTDR